MLKVLYRFLVIYLIVILCEIWLAKDFVINNDEKYKIQLISLKH